MRVRTRNMPGDAGEYARALACRECREQATDVFAQLDLVERIPGVHGRQHAAGGGPDAAQPRAEAVQGYAEQVGRRVVDPVDPVPPFSQLDEGSWARSSASSALPVMKTKAL